MSAHVLGRDCTPWCLCLLTTHIRMVARSWSFLGAEPVAMLKTMLSTGSKVTNSSSVGAAPAIKYHLPRCGSGNCRERGDQKRVGPHYRAHSTSSSSLLRRQDLAVAWQLVFSNEGLGYDRKSLSDFSFVAPINLSNRPPPNSTMFPH